MCTWSCMRWNLRVSLVFIAVNGEELFKLTNLTRGVHVRSSLGIRNNANNDRISRHTRTYHRRRLSAKSPSSTPLHGTNYSTRALWSPCSSISDGEGFCLHRSAARSGRRKAPLRSLTDSNFLPLSARRHGGTGRRPTTRIDNYVDDQSADMTRPAVLDHHTHGTVQCVCVCVCVLPRSLSNSCLSYSSPWSSELLALSALGRWRRGLINEYSISANELGLRTAPTTRSLADNRHCICRAACPSLISVILRYH